MSGAQSDIDLICSATSLLHDVICQRKNAIYKELETSGATSLVNGLRLCRVQRAILMIGVFSLYESLLQTEFEWKSPFYDLPKSLTENGKTELARTFEQYRDGVNVLKHGLGKSHSKLLNNKQSLDFLLKSNTDDMFFKEGDVNEGDMLIYVTEDALLRCVDIVSETLEAARIAQRS